MAHSDVGSRAKVRTNRGTGCADRAQGAEHSNDDSTGTVCVVLERATGAEAQTPG